MTGREATPVPLWAAIVTVRHRLELHVQRRHPAARRHLHAGREDTGARPSTRWSASIAPAWSFICLPWRSLSVWVPFCLGWLPIGCAGAESDQRSSWGLVAAVFIATQFALILHLPIPSYLQWAVVAAVGAATVLSFAILAEYFPKQLAGRANGALNLFHIAAAFVVQYATGVVLQHWTPQAGHYPEIAYQTAFALNLALQVVAWIWFMFPRVRLDSRQRFTREPCSNLGPGRR
jgi:hypothetical protein